MKRVMVDIECLGNDPATACIVQVGACYFDLDGPTGEVLKINIDAHNAVRNGAVLEPAPVHFWLKQSDEARQSILSDGWPETTALGDLSYFIEEADEIWSHATYDFVLLQGAYKRTGMDSKMSFRKARDLRTLVALAGVTYDQDERVGTHHDALDDCKFQINYTVKSLKKLGVTE